MDQAAHRAVLRDEPRRSTLGRRRGIAHVHRADRRLVRRRPSMRRASAAISRWAATLRYCSPIARGVASPLSARAQFALDLGLGWQRRQPVRLRLGRRAAAQQDQRRPIRPRQGDGRLGGHAAGAAGDDDHVAGSERRCAVDARQRPHRRHRRVRIARRDRPTSAGPASSISSTRASAASIRIGQSRPGRSPCSCTSGHSWPAVLARPARPPSSGSRHGSKSPRPKAPSRRDTVTKSAPPSRPPRRRRRPRCSAEQCVLQQARRPAGRPGARMTRPPSAAGGSMSRRATAGARSAGITAAAQALLERLARSASSAVDPDFGARRRRTPARGATLVAAERRARRCAPATAGERATSAP